MPDFRAKRRVHHSADQMFDLVADIERYHEFVPLCQRHIIRSRKKCGDSEILLTAAIMDEIFLQLRQGRAQPEKDVRPGLSMLAAPEARA